MSIIYQTPNFILESHDKPEIDRLDGGHIKISPKFDIEDRTQMTPSQAVEFIRLSILAGRAMKLGLEKQGIMIGRINYQENGNWNPHFHLHLYGRAIDATYQKYGEPITPGHRDIFKSLNEDDIKAIQTVIKELRMLPEFSDEKWRLR